MFTGSRCLRWKARPCIIEGGGVYVGGGVFMRKGVRAVGVRRGEGQVRGHKIPTTGRRMCTNSCLVVKPTQNANTCVRLKSGCSCHGLYEFVLVRCGYGDELKLGDERSLVAKWLSNFILNCRVQVMDGKSEGLGC